MSRHLLTQELEWHPIDKRWVSMQVQADAHDPHTIDACGYSFVEAGATHTETALEDTLLLVLCEEDRPGFRR